MKTIIIIIINLFIIIRADNTVAEFFNHSLYDSLLLQYVTDGLVEYMALKLKPELLSRYLMSIEQVNPKDFKNWSKDEQKAFWINSYNTITIEGIVRNYPIQTGELFSSIRFPQNSIRQIKGFWDKVFIRVMGKEITLDEIEHEILRKKFKDPRIHFVLVCASMGCPLLENRSFLSKNLSNRLENSTSNFINNPDKVYLDREKNILYLSSIFKWYREDFSVSNAGNKLYYQYNNNERGVVEFVVKYFQNDSRQFVINNHPKIKYLKYDWSLNEKR